MGTNSTMIDFDKRSSFLKKKTTDRHGQINCTRCTNEAVDGVLKAYEQETSLVRAQFIDF